LEKDRKGDRGKEQKEQRGGRGSGSENAIYRYLIMYI
jgi:hypothetical protein